MGRYLAACVPGCRARFHSGEGPWFVLQTTGSAAKTGLVGAALALGLLVPILGGPLVDRLGFRRGSVVADLVSGATVASIPLLHLAGLLEYWHIVVLVFILASVNSQGDTARLALVPALARLAQMPFERVNARDRAILRLGAVQGMDVRREPAAEPTDGRAAAQDGDSMIASRTTDIH
jgi:hypothetical protein